MSKINKNQVKQYMLKLISDNEINPLDKTINNFNISKSTAYNYLNELIKDNVISKSTTNSKYILNSRSYKFYYKNENLSEDQIFDNDIAPILSNFEKNVFSIWRYSFTEMMNNAIEHSLSNRISVVVETNPLNTSIYVCDDGIGIFKNIQQYIFNEKKEKIPIDDCVTLLFSGKFTTAKSLHSGEGIFFTSHLMDRFIIYSDEITFSRDSFKDTQIMSNNLDDINKGTVVFMVLHNHSKKTTKEVFDRFSDVDEGFIKTQIPVAHIFSNGNPVSRSEARRLGELVSKFKEIDLDFTNVEEVGQAFCHELFVVWQKRNPDVLFNICNANEDVSRMIKRVKNTK